MMSLGIGDVAYFGPEAEFFVFDDVRFSADPYNTGFQLDSSELPSNSDTAYEGGNLGHRVRTKGGYFPVPPVDSAQDMRSEMLAAMARWASPSKSTTTRSLGAARTRPEVRHARPRRRPSADLQILHPSGRAFLRQDGHLHAEAGFGDNGSGMHVHQSIWKGGKPVFAGDKYADLSRSACTISAASSSTPRRSTPSPTRSTNSYKRLVPGFEAPVLLAYSSRNRSASCRIPYVNEPEGEAHRGSLPRSDANPYLAFAAMLMAGLDGIKNKIDPGAPADKDLYDLPPEELKAIPTVCGSLREALDSLKADHAYLLDGGVFTEDFIQAWIDLKYTELMRYEMTPHPVEFDMYSRMAPSSVERASCICCCSALYGLPIRRSDVSS